MRGPFAAVEPRHLAEERPGLEDGERLFAAAWHVAADSYLALDDEVEPIPALAFAKDVLATLVLLLLAHLGDLGELGLVQVLEDRDVLEQLDGVGHAAPRSEETASSDSLSGVRRRGKRHARSAQPPTRHHRL